MAPRRRSSESDPGEVGDVDVRSIRDAIEASAPRPDLSDSQDSKRKYSERFSKKLAICIAQAIRRSDRRFRGIRPDPTTGTPGEASVVTASGTKKSLDVSYSTAEHGLGLVVSIKTVTHPDPSSGRYAKNFSGRDYELQAEATQLHTRYPYAVLVAVHFMPIAACNDGAQSHSSFSAGVNRYFKRAGRDRPTDDPGLFERFFVAVYDDAGECWFWDVAADPPPTPSRFHAPPKRRAPTPDDGALSFQQFVQRVVEVYDYRNNRRLVFMDEPPEEVESDELEEETNRGVEAE
jgi:hypothetical protein